MQRVRQLALAGFLVLPAGCGFNVAYDAVSSGTPPDTVVEVIGYDMFRHPMKTATDLVISPSETQISLADSIWRKECHVQISSFRGKHDPLKLQGVGHEGQVITFGDTFFVGDSIGEAANLGILFPLRERSFGDPSGQGGNLFGTTKVVYRKDGILLWNVEGITPTNPPNESNYSAVQNGTFGASILIAAHEIGHQLGLRHTIEGTSSTELMASTPMSTARSIEGFDVGATDATVGSECDRARVLGETSFYTSGVVGFDPPHGN